VSIGIDRLQEAEEGTDRKSWKHGDAPNDQNMLETGSDDPIALSVEDSSGAAPFMKDNGLPCWDRLPAGRGLYQVFVRDRNAASSN
jgi:hypothetical protein